ncbi:MAG: TIGR03557 family F420-dependent LLM class oxidoreductase [Actinomycetota bacterium]|nr:TIGR03557 family F420-dependent LLM class oxidoreductase [Actinomycetota bacterium]
MPLAVELGYALSSEEHEPGGLVANARAAEEAGFGFGLISDHYHPWVDAQGHSAFVWSVIGAISQATERFRIGTGVTCPMIRTHPAIVAHAAATCACLMPGRFFIGVGTGENLNEHILGDKWPAPDERLEMLEESVEVMRLLWQGGYQTHRGKHYTVENARVFDLPDEPIEVAVAAMQPLAAELAGRIGDSYVNTSPDADLVERFDGAGGEGKPKYGQVTVCWAESEEEAKQTAFEKWPNAAIQGAASQELALPEHFEQLAQSATPDDVAEAVVLGPDPAQYLEQIQQFDEAGFTHVYLHQIGPDQQGFLEFARRELLPRF